MGRHDDPGGIADLPGAPRSRASRPPGSHPVLRLVAIAVTAVLIAVSLTAYVMVRNLYAGIDHQAVTTQMLGPRPPKLDGSTNILIIGSDSRAGTHGQFGAKQLITGARSDTSMLLHISPDHSHAYVISFPRDSMVPIYGCMPDQQGHPGQSAAPGQLEMLNATFSDGGAPCLWKTLEQTTHVRIDHFVQVDFNSFRTIVDDLGGISICLPFAIHNPQAHLNLSAGRHLVRGSQALAFVRLRESIGDGSDIQRIMRQQLFLASAAQKIKQASLLSDFKMISDISHAMATDLTLTDMLGIANSLKALNPAAVRFITVPSGAYPLDPNRVIWVQPQAQQLFSAIARDSHIRTAMRAAARQAVGPLVAPSRVRVRVLNGSGRPGLAGATATILSARGFSVTGTGDANSFHFTSPVIEYGSAAQAAQVNTLRNQVPGATVQQASGLPPGTLTLILGSKFTGLAGRKARHARRSVASVTQSLQGISGNQNICNDGAAFAGPLSPAGG